MAGTVILQPTTAVVAAQTAQLYPNRWANEAAKAPGGVLGALLTAIGSQLAFALVEANYGLNTQRLQTETSPELDLASVDFFGAALPRIAGQTDTVFLNLIRAALFAPMATRAALIQAITNMVGVVPRMVEPWNPADTGCRDNTISYRDIDTVTNPLENTSAFLGYNGFITTALPTNAVLGANPFLTRDDSAYRDTNEYRLTVQASTVNQLYDLINRVRAFGTVLWVKFK